MLLRKFSNINTYIKVVVKLPKQYFNALFFSNPGDKVLILVESRGQICPIVSLFLDLVPWIGQYWYIKMLILHFSNYLDINVYVGKLSEKHFNVRLFCNSGDKNLVLLTLYEVRNSE